MPFYRCSSGGGVNVSDNYQIELPTLQQFILNPLDWMKKSVPLKGVIIGVPQKDAYSFGSMSIHTKDKNLLKLFYGTCDNALRSDSSIPVNSLYCIENPSGGFDTNRGAYYTSNYGPHPTWEIINGIYTANRLTGSVNNNTTLVCYVRFIW